jgi:hypothetical protein
VKTKKNESPIGVEYITLTNGVVGSAAPRVAMAYGENKKPKLRGSYGRAAPLVPPEPAKPLNVIAIKITGRDKTFYLVSDHEDSLMARELYLASPSRILNAADFKAAKTDLMHSAMGQGMIAATKLIERLVPEMQFVPKGLLPVVIDPDHPERPAGETVAAMLWKFDLTGFGALFHASGDAVRPEDVAKWVDPDGMMHLRKSWFAFKNVDDAVMLKVVRKDTSKVYPLS